MFIYNLKLNKKKASIIFISLALIIIIGIVLFSIYTIFFKSTAKSGCDIPSSHVIEINENNYTSILKASNNNIDDYIGDKVRVTGYVYRLLDFDENQFVVARDMKINEKGQSVVVGFLCTSDKASDFEDGTWVEIEGEIIKGFFNGDIAMLKVISIKESTSPENIFVNPPDVPKDAKGDGPSPLVH